MDRHIPVPAFNRSTWGFAEEEAVSGEAGFPSGPLVRRGTGFCRSGGGTRWLAWDFSGRAAVQDRAIGREYARVTQSASTSGI